MVGFTFDPKTGAVAFSLYKRKEIARNVLRQNPKKTSFQKMLRCLDKCQAVLLKNTMVLQTGCYFGTLPITRCKISKIRTFHNSSIEVKWKTLLKEAGLGDTHPPQTFTSRNPTQPGIVLISGL